MSWLARSIADSFRIEDDEDEEEDDDNEASPITGHLKLENGENEAEEEDRAGRGVREDLSELTETLTRQLWGVASFLAPPPPPPPPPLPRLLSRLHIDRSFEYQDQRELLDPSGSGEDSDDDAPGSVGISGSQDEASDGFVPGLPNQSSSQVVSENWRMDSNFLPFEREDPIGSAAGITEEVLAFAMNIAHHPETWLDFPLEEEDDLDDFNISDSQHEHALAIQRLAPRLAALRIELCPGHMSEGYFWKVYFVLLHSRLNKHDAELLSTPQIVAARTIWMQELHKRTKTETYWYGRNTSFVKESTNTWQGSLDYAPSGHAPGNIRTFSFGPSNSLTAESETEKHPVASAETHIVDKSVIEETPVATSKDFLTGSSFKLPVLSNNDEDDDDDDWLREDSDNGIVLPLGHHEDVSFSDLEDDDCTMPVKSKLVTIVLDTTPKTSSGGSFRSA